eukprot:12423479-Karenia_brevis.AAC.1
MTLPAKHIADKYGLTLDRRYVDHVHRPRLLNTLDRLEARLRRGISLFFVKGKGLLQHHSGHVADLLSKRIVAFSTSSFVRMNVVTPK